MIDYQKFYDHISQAGLEKFLDNFTDSIESAFTNSDIKKWAAALQRLPELAPSSVDIAKPAIQIGSADDCSIEDKALLETQLRQFMPWRRIMRKSSKSAMTTPFPGKKRRMTWEFPFKTRSTAPPWGPPLPPSRA